MGQLYNIYCDESCHLEHDGEIAMTIGGIWCPQSKKDEIFHRIREIKEEHGLSKNFEIKWNKVSPGQLDFYMDVVNYFFDNSDLHFRVLVIPNKQELKHDLFSQTHDDFYYKMYFNMLKTLFEPGCGYNIYIDIKDTRGQRKVGALSYIHRGKNTSEAKLRLIERIKARSGYNLTASTLYRENKFNIFVWRSGYGK